MEIRRDPITQSWVVVGHREPTERSLSVRTAGDRQTANHSLRPAEGPGRCACWPHPDPLYRIEGEPGRLPDGMYDRMGPTGAHEIVVETPDHNNGLSQLERRRDRTSAVGLGFAHRGPEKRSPPQVCQRIQESGRAGRRRVVARAFADHRNDLCAAPHQVRAARRPRMVQGKGTLRFLRHRSPGREARKRASWTCRATTMALCPYASRVPYEVWLLHRRHNHLFEQPRPGTNRRHLAASAAVAVLRRLRRLRRRTTSCVHTAPNTCSTRAKLPRILEDASPTTFTGTSKSCPSSKRAASPTASRKSISTRSCRKQAAEQLRAIDPNS